MKLQEASQPTSPYKRDRFNVLPPPSKLTLVYPCRKSCPGGNHCYCNGDVIHTLHICSDEGCYCHTKERYAKEKFL